MHINLHNVKGTKFFKTINLYIDIALRGNMIIYLKQLRCSILHGFREEHNQIFKTLDVQYHICSIWGNLITYSKHLRCSILYSSRRELGVTSRHSSFHSWSCTLFLSMVTLKRSQNFDMKFFQKNLIWCYSKIKLLFYVIYLMMIFASY